MTRLAVLIVASVGVLGYMLGAALVAYFQQAGLS